MASMLITFRTASGGRRRVRVAWPAATAAVAAFAAAKGKAAHRQVLTGGHWVTTHDGRHLYVKGGEVEAGLGKQAGHGPLAGGQGAPGHGPVLAERDNTHAALEAAVRRSQAAEGAHHLDIKVASGPARNAREERFAARAHAAGRAAIVAERVPKVREESAGERTILHVGGRPHAEVRPVEARDRERVQSKYADIRAKRPEGYEPNVTDPGHRYVHESIAAKLDDRDRWVETGRDFEGSHRTKEAALKAARASANYAVKDEARTASDHLTIAHVGKHNWTDEAYQHPEYTTTFRLIAPKAGGTAVKATAAPAAARTDKPKAAKAKRGTYVMGDDGEFHLVARKPRS
jgi:hypothetical protein